MKIVKLTIRDFINDITGQNEKIKQYEEITHRLASAADLESDQTRKHAIIENYKDLTELQTIHNDDVSFSIDSFNQYKPLQSRKLTEKIEHGKKIIAQFNLCG